jgi:cytochrome c oxidase assembly protein subunit 15
VDASTITAAAARPNAEAVPAADWRRAIPAPVRRRLRAWLWSIAAMTLAVLVIGGITRLTQSGLSIVDWRPLVGAVPPLTDAQWLETFDRYRQYPEYQQLRRGMTLAEFKVIFFWEYLHRLVARLIGVVFLVPFAAFWLAGRLPRPLLARALALFALGGLQGVMGWLMVRSGLVDRPSVSHVRLAAHLSLAFVIFGYAVWLARDLASGGAHPRVAAAARRLMARGLAVVGGLLAAQIVWGAFVAGLDAGLIFNTFPLMGGALVPPTWMALSPAMLNAVQNPATVQWAHRVLGTLLLAVSAAVWWRIRRASPDPLSRRLNAALALLVAGQYLLGVLTLVYVVPIPLAVTHQATAMVIAGVWVAWAHHVTRVLTIAD